jgi:hypothetical protein
LKIDTTKLKQKSNKMLGHWEMPPTPCWHSVVPFISIKEAFMDSMREALMMAE